MTATDSKTPPANTEPVTMQQEIEKVSALVTNARQLLIGGAPIDFVALETKVDTLCQSIHAAPPRNSREIRRALAVIVDDLDALEHELTERHRRLERNLAERTRKLALEAYSDPTEIEGSEDDNDKDATR